jgi:ribose/xylose/arabinose/galactoside ABC-type transport system permease subunit
MGGVLIALFVLAFVQNALGLAGVLPEEEQIVTGTVLIVTLVVFRAFGSIGRRAFATRRLPTSTPTAQAASAEGRRAR